MTNFPSTEAEYIAALNMDNAKSRDFLAAHWRVSAMASLMATAITEKLDRPREIN